MGVKNLWDILESCKKTLPLHHLQNKRVCIDLSCWMVQLQSVNKSQCLLKDKVYLRGLFHRLRALIALNCSVIFVSDGSIPGIKVSTYRRRLNGGTEASVDAENACDVSSVKRNKGSVFSCMIKEAKFLGGALGIPCLDGVEEAEAQCALLNSESLCDGCFTSDSDAFLFGARTVYRDICLGEGGYVVCYEMDDIERKLGFGRNSLITLAVLLGSDYTRGVRGFGPESACQIVKSIGDVTVLQRFASEGLSITKKQKNSKKKGQNNADHERDLTGKKCDLPIENQFLQVINAYLKPKCHSADSDAVRKVLGVYSFSRSQLHQICDRYFEWPPEKADEYILPKIAERNLRRFANLRSSSSELGVHVPVNEMPVKCPISSIVKTRKLQGRDYFEVSWDDMDGLNSSTVPADLVESACPEKILEFQQRKAEKKKPTRKSKPKKVDKAAEMKEIDRKLQELLLEIEQENTRTSNAVILGGSVPEKIEKITRIDVDDQRMCLNTESESGNMGSSSFGCHATASRTTETESESECEIMESFSFGCRSTASRTMATEIESESKIRGSFSFGYHSTSSSTMETEIVDLISPPPRVRSPRSVRKCQPARCLDVIELSESDNDVSPDHARKARDLRLFIANVRDDIS